MGRDPDVLSAEVSGSIRTMMKHLRRIKRCEVKFVQATRFLPGEMVEEPSGCCKWFANDLLPLVPVPVSGFVEGLRAMGGCSLPFQFDEQTMAMFGATAAHPTPQELQSVLGAMSGVRWWHEDGGDMGEAGSSAGTAVTAVTAATNELAGPGPRQLCVAKAKQQLKQQQQQQLGQQAQQPQQSKCMKLARQQLKQQQQQHQQGKPGPPLNIWDPAYDMA
eukprot:15485799-Alexandrium_andersonii.AAC.1